MSLLARVLRHKSVEQLQAEIGSRRDFRRVLGVWQLTAIGIGGIIGVGVFVLASPLPDELGVAILGANRLDMRLLLPLAFIATRAAASNSRAPIAHPAASINFHAIDKRASIYFPRLRT